MTENPSTATLDPIAGMSFGRSFGAKAVEARAAEAAARAKARAIGSDKVNYLKIDDGKSVIIRFLTDIVAAPSNPVPWITVNQHSNVKTRRQPAGYQGKWPATMGAVCRMDDLFNGRYHSCYICDHMLVHDGDQAGKPHRVSARTWALALVREEVFGTPEMAAAGQCTEAQIGKAIGVRTKRHEVKVLDKDGKETGEVRWDPEVVWLNYGEKNFFGTICSIIGRKSTILDVDLEVKRYGTNRNTDYRISPFPEMMVPDPDDESREVKLDLRDPRFMLAIVGQKKDAEGNLMFWPADDDAVIAAEEAGVRIAGQPMADLPDLRYALARQASDDFYGRFFDETAERDDEKAKPAGTGGQPGTAAPPAPAPADVPGPLLDALKDRVLNYPGAQGGTNGQSTGQPAAARISNL